MVTALIKSGFSVFKRRISNAPKIPATKAEAKNNGETDMRGRWEVRASGLMILEHPSLIIANGTKQGAIKEPKETSKQSP